MGDAAQAAGISRLVHSTTSFREVACDRRAGMPLVKSRVSGDDKPRQQWHSYS
jgi:hypothetical protein